MNDIAALVLAGLAGLVLGACFFGTLWWTIQKSVTSQQPALLFLGSFALRMSAALAGFYLVGHTDWRRLVACLLGFVIARCIALRLAPAPGEPKPSSASQANHAT